MSRYRWLKAAKCLETMGYFPSLKGLECQEMERLLFNAVARGDIAALLNDEIIPKAHIEIYLKLFNRSRGTPDDFGLPSDIGFNYDDLCAVFDRPVVDGRKRGRPAKEHSGGSHDEMLIFEMHKMLAGAPNLPPASSATEAARILVDAGRVLGAGTPESRAKRLVRSFRKRFSS